MARANVSSSDRSELLPSLRFSYILVAAGGWFYPLPVIILEHPFPPTGFLWLGSAVRYSSMKFKSTHRFLHFDFTSTILSFSVCLF